MIVQDSLGAQRTSGACDVAMKRSGSKLIAKAASVKNINKLGFRFEFELQLESCDNILGSSEIVCTWERKAKLVHSAPYKVDKAKRLVNFGGEVLRQEVTMFKKRKADPGFEAKVFRLTVRGGSETGKIIGRVDLNFADFVEIPSLTKRVGASLDSGSRLIFRVTSNFLGEVEPRKQRRNKAGAPDDDAASVASDSTIGESGSDSCAAGAVEELSQREQDEEDLNDLIINGDPLPKATISSVESSSTQSQSTYASSQQRSTAAPGLSAYRREKSSESAVLRANSSGEAVANYSSTGQHVTSRTAGNAYNSSARTRDNDCRNLPAGGHAGVNNSLGGSIPAPDSVSRSEVERLRTENKALRRANDQLKERLTELGIGSSNGMSNSADIQTILALTEENKNLRRNIEDLETQIAREPVYADVVRELRESKVALAILSLERDELQQAMKSYDSSRNPIAARNLL